MPAVQLPAASRVQRRLGLHGYDLQSSRFVPLMMRRPPIIPTQSMMFSERSDRGWSRRNVLSLGAGATFFAATGLRVARAQTQLRIESGAIKPIDIAIPAFVPGTPQ